MLVAMEELIDLRASHAITEAEYIARRRALLAGTEPKPKPTASFGRIMVTPIIVVIVGYLIGGMYGLAVGAFIGIVYVLVASDRAKRAP